jgi:hypothetical protein
MASRVATRPTNAAVSSSPRRRRYSARWGQTPSEGIFRKQSAQDIRQ